MKDEAPQQEANVEANAPKNEKNPKKRGRKAKAEKEDTNSMTENAPQAEGEPVMDMPIETPEANAIPEQGDEFIPIEDLPSEKVE